MFYDHFTADNQLDTTGICVHTVAATPPCGVWGWGGGLGPNQ